MNPFYEQIDTSYEETDMSLMTNTFSMLDDEGDVETNDIDVELQFGIEHDIRTAADLKEISPEVSKIFNELFFGPKASFDNWLTNMENKATFRVNESNVEELPYDPSLIEKKPSRFDEKNINYDGFVRLVANVIKHSFSDAKPLSVIMAVSNFGASATPDLESVYDAHMFLTRKHRVGKWTGLLGAEPYLVMKRFTDYMQDWDRGVNFGRAAVSAAIVALIHGDEEFISKSTAAQFVYNDGLFNFWCQVAGICPKLVKDHYGLTSLVSDLCKNAMDVKFSKKHRIKHSSVPKIDLSQFSVIDESKVLKVVPESGRGAKRAKASARQARTPRISRKSSQVQTQLAA